MKLCPWCPSKRARKCCGSCNINFSNVRCTCASEVTARKSWLKLRINMPFTCGTRRKILNVLSKCGPSTSCRPPRPQCGPCSRVNWNRYAQCAISQRVTRGVCRVIGLSSLRSFCPRCTMSRTLTRSITSDPTTTSWHEESIQQLSIFSTACGCLTSWLRSSSTTSRKGSSNRRSNGSCSGRPSTRSIMSSTPFKFTWNSKSSQVSNKKTSMLYSPLTPSPLILTHDPRPSSTY